MKKSNAEKISEMLQVVANMMQFADGVDASDVYHVLHDGFEKMSDHWFAKAIKESEFWNYDSESYVEAFINAAKKYEKITEMIDRAYFDEE